MRKGDESHKAFVYEARPARPSGAGLPERTPQEEKESSQARAPGGRDLVL